MKAIAFEILQSKVSLNLSRLTVQAQSDLARSGSSRENNILLERFYLSLPDACLPQRLKCSRIWLMDIANASVGGPGPWRPFSAFSTTENTILRFIAPIKQVGRLPEDVKTDHTQLEEHTALVPVHPNSFGQCRAPHHVEMEDASSICFATSSLESRHSRSAKPSWACTEKLWRCADGKAAGYRITATSAWLFCFHQIYMHTERILKHHASLTLPAKDWHRSCPSAHALDM